MARPSRNPAPGGPNVAIVSAVVVVAIALVAVVGVRLLSDGGGDEETSAPPEAPATTLSPACAQIHSGHNTMSWNPTMADEMVDCAWPYDPFATTLDGGEEDSALDAAPFEPRLYADLWTMLGDAGLGVCAVPNLPDESAEGFTFGFSYGAAEPGCPNAEPTIEMIVREYSTRPQRDAAAHSAVADTESPPTFVLGRWMITLHGDDEAETTALTEGLTGLGAVQVGG